MSNKRLFFQPILILLNLAVISLQAQNPVQEITAYRQQQLLEITSLPESPLWPEDSAQINYFENNSRYSVRAKVELLKGEKPFKMPTYAGTTKEFIRYAKLHFEIEGTGAELTAYKNLSLPGPLASLNNTLFIPFMDETNGSETYGGGRYLDLTIDKKTNEVLLDFNKAYNPYCAYADGYRCPVPPQENHLSFKVPAGEMRYTGPRRNREARPESNISLQFNQPEQDLILSGDTTTMLKVIQVTDSSELSILRSTSKDISHQDPLLPLLARRMLLSVQDTSRPGVGIAAPQVGINRNLIWVQRLDKDESPFELYLNPVITWRSNLMTKGPEGCLSIPDTRGDVNRHHIIQIEYLTPEGLKKTELLEGFVAVIFQHEIDHLHGMLFTDYLGDQPGKWPVNPEMQFFFHHPPSFR